MSTRVLRHVFLCALAACLAGRAGGQETGDPEEFRRIREQLRARYAEAALAADLEAKRMAAEEMARLELRLAGNEDGAAGADGAVPGPDAASKEFVVLGLPMLEELGGARWIGTAWDVGRTARDLQLALEGLLDWMGSLDASEAHRQALWGHVAEFEQMADDRELLEDDPAPAEPWELADLRDRVEALRKELTAMLGSSSLADRVRDLALAFERLAARVEEGRQLAARLPEVLTLGEFVEARKRSGLPVATFHEILRKHYVAWQRPLISQNEEVSVTVLGESRWWLFSDFLGWLEQIDDHGPPVKFGQGPDDWRAWFEQAFPGKGEALFEALWNRQTAPGALEQAAAWGELFDGMPFANLSGEQYESMAGGRPIDWIQVVFPAKELRSPIAAHGDKKYLIVVHGEPRYRTARDLAEIRETMSRMAEASAELSLAMLGGVSSIPVSTPGKVLYSLDVGIQAVDGALHVLDEQEIRPVLRAVAAVKGLLDAGVTLKTAGGLDEVLEGVGKGADSLGKGLSLAAVDLTPELAAIQALVAVSSPAAAK